MQNCYVDPTGLLLRSVVQIGQKKHGVNLSLDPEGRVEG